MNKVILEDIEYICGENICWELLSNKNILITGANGILPSYMVDTILTLLNKEIISNVKVYALCRSQTKAQNRFDYYSENKNLIFLFQDVCSSIEIDDDIHIIIHAASQASPKYYAVDPVGTIEPNVIGTNNLLKFAKNKNIEKFLYFSSAEVYGFLNSNDPIKETDFGYIDSLNIRSCYAESKKIGETLCYSWLMQHNVPIQIVRPFHTYGPGMSLNDGRIFADLVCNVLRNENLKINSDGSAKRAFCYIRDAVAAYFYILLKGEIGIAYNVGNPAEEYSIKEFALMLIALFPDKKLSIELNPSHSSSYIPSAISRVLPDISRIKNLGWKPKVNIKEGFYRTIMSY